MPSHRIGLEDRLCGNISGPVHEVLLQLWLVEVKKTEARVEEV